jgi:hypothetical protein
VNTASKSFDSYAVDGGLFGKYARERKVPGALFDSTTAKIFNTATPI